MGLKQLALIVAQAAHFDQVDKGGAPYMQHSLSVANEFHVKDTSARVVAILHDVIEDTIVTLDILRSYGFPVEIVEAVDAISRRKEELYFDYIRRVKMNPLASRVKLADLKDNMSKKRMSALPIKEQKSLMKRYQKAYNILSEEI